ncbi:S1C family serine protease [Gryllotalpicola protaetiae]|uniref:PDZ domain-containing protein n=1 Tax=Gryllotalpicola protaetiae TaxID=2419771 RepID=A0A387BNA9_9MICO|nr:trypsin-like peptidase domain-containing protein [Gryllotalpicola protaetiae]AYG02486.1 PDZ domain-containing protein [Gryllotalpicola protaetiae]
MSDNANEPVNPEQPESAQPENPTAAQQPEWQAPAQASAPQQPATPAQPAAPQAPRWGEYASQQPGQPAQPAAQQPPQSTQPYPGTYQPGYQHTQPTQPLGGYAQPQQQAPQQPQQHPYYAQFTSPQPMNIGQQPQPGQPGQPQVQKPRSTLTGKSIAIIAAALVVGGLLGGGVAGGVNALANHNSGTPVSISGGGSGASNITVQDPKNATQVTAVAAKASNSVVTINVTGQQESGTGSGVILTDDGYILTNTHVVTLDGDESDGQIQVQTNDGSLYTAKVIGTDPTDDLAVIKLNNASGLTPINWGDSTKLNVGDQVIAIGAPLGLQGTVTDGIVSALNRSVTLESSAPKQAGGSGGNDDQNPFGGGFGGGNPFDQGQQSSDTSSIFVPAIQTDAAINPGNSGGALLNDSGELVGINVAIASTGSSDGSTQSGNIGVGFAIPAAVAHRIADELKDSGKATHGLLGATVSNAAAQQDATTVGAHIESVNSGSAAGNAGLKAGDVVTNVGGVPITSSDDLTAQIRSAAAGSTVKLTYVRDGKTYQTDVTLGSYSPQS